MPRAIIVRGEPVFVDADVRTWHEHGLEFRGRRARRETRAVVLHWTGGEGGATDVFGVLRARKPDPLSVQFFVDQLGVIWQFCDAVALCAQCQGANAWSVGVEIANRSRPPAEHPKWPRELYEDRIHGRRRTTARFLPAQADAALKLTAALCRAFELPLDVPRDQGGQLVAGSLPASQLAAYRGVLGHLHVNPAKPDPGTEILRAVAELGGRPA